ncbi:hypothetical protein D3C76_1075700 [compost metagenome]
MQVAHHRHVQHCHHHCMLFRGQRRAGECHRYLLPGGGTQQGVVQAQGLAALVPGQQVRIGPDRYVRFLQEIQELLALQLLHRGIEQSRHCRVGKAHQTVLTDHQDALGGVFQHRGIERASDLQVMTQALQCPAIALVLEQRLDLGLEDLWVEGFEQIIHRATGIPLDHGILGLFIGGQENDRCQVRTLAATHQARHFKTVHARHLHIKQHQVDIVFKQQPERLETGGSGDDLPILALQQCTHADQVFRVIIDDQQG